MMSYLRRSKEQSITIHMGLALSLAFLSLLFFLTGVLANVEVENMCTWVGAMLHYALLSSLTWMGIEVFNTFWLVYMVCWIKVTDQRALLAHYFTTMTILAILVSSGIIMLFLVYRKIRTRDEWKQNRVAFLSIWGLSCLFGTTWGLTFLNYDPLSDFILFLSCFLNSFQG
ncbi:hypothetical protein GOODEAATRI_009132 [Goodea atripinnis]|uniref:G-protein coupled receptors family 2 profile 2 domain-containing protein n=1 Tax=Goodea atripinnis TaxID=208336 RepID=A0ABV0N959_9TELE